VTRSISNDQSLAGSRHEKFVRGTQELSFKLAPMLRSPTLNRVRNL